MLRCTIFMQEIRFSGKMSLIFCQTSRADIQHLFRSEVVVSAHLLIITKVILQIFPKYSGKIFIFSNLWGVL